MPEIGRPPPHKTSHQDAGSDEIDITGLAGAVGLDDTPVDEEITKGITSNWAFDENVTLRALIEATLPWTIFIDVFHTPKSHSFWSSLIISGIHIYAAYLASAGNQNDQIAWDVVLGAGTWSVELIYYKGTSHGIFSVQLDSVEKGTIDSYKTGPGYNNKDSVTGIVVPLTKKIELKIKMATKNNASAGYTGIINGVRLIRTA